MSEKGTEGLASSGGSVAQQAPVSNRIDIIPNEEMGEFQSSCANPESRGWHNDEREHHRKERRYWCVTVVLTALAAGGAIATVFLSNSAVEEARIATKETRRQADAASKQLTLAFPPKLSVYAIHIWERGAGREFGEDNIIPPLVNGKTLDGVAYIVNKGREDATVTSSNIVLKWMTERINMVNPLWGAPDNRLLGVVEWGNRNHPVIAQQHNLGPNQSNMWEFTTVVEGQNRQPGQADAILYVFGTVNYIDSTETQHDLAFTRRYDPSKGRFVRADDATEDTENEDPLPGAAKGN